MGDYDSALADFNRAIELSPDDSRIYIRRGLVWSKKGEGDKAIADYDKAYIINSSDPNPVKFRDGLINRGK
ncbi:MAG: tetratricopeptide repeat protein [Deltaproteobacteria bacterium]|nr:tetratricopeptide repeat protein [Deltaproteobacteria bacterium]